jgi:hypothetical protein
MGIRRERAGGEPAGVSYTRLVKARDRKIGGDIRVLVGQ